MPNYLFLIANSLIILLVASPHHPPMRFISFPLARRRRGAEFIELKIASAAAAERAGGGGVGWRG
jgi:hypothetical protein